MTDTVIHDPMLDEEWLAAPVKRSRLRTILVLLLAGAFCFLGGAVVQQLGSGSDAATPAGPAGFAAGQLPAGLGQGDFPNAAPGGSNAPVDGPVGADDTASVIGTVVKVSGHVWTVEDLGGKRHQVSVGDDTDVIRESRMKSGDVKVGDPVDVSGTNSNGQLAADEVTLR